MDKDNDLHDEEVEYREDTRRGMPGVFVSHSKEIVSTIVIGVIVTILSAFINDYFFEEDSFSEYPVADYQNIPPEVSAPSMRQHFIRANLANVIANITPIKMHINEYFMVKGTFPKTNKDMDLSMFDLQELDVIENAYLTDNGSVDVELSNEFGDGKILSIQPIASKNGAFIKWRCVTNIERKYLGVNKMCESSF